MSDWEMFCLRFKMLALRIRIVYMKVRALILKCLLRLVRQDMSNSI